MREESPSKRIERLDKIFKAENLTADQKIVSIVNRTANALERPVTSNRSEHVLQQLLAEPDYNCTSDRTGVKADPWTITKFSAMMGSFEIAIKKRGVETATVAEIKLYDQLCQHRLKLECVKGSKVYTRKAKLLEEGKNPFNGRNETLFSKVMEKNMANPHMPFSPIRAMPPPTRAL